MNARGLFARADGLLLPLAVFVGTYLAAFLAARELALLSGLLYVQWVALVSVSVATVVTIVFVERNVWDLGLRAAPITIVREALPGAAFACVLILIADRLILAATNLHRVAGAGFPWPELTVVFLPAALHEELLFRGYPYQKLRQWSASRAERRSPEAHAIEVEGVTAPSLKRVALYWMPIVVTSLVFALLHGGNHGITAMALGNLLLAGVLLALAYELHLRLWFPIGLHFAWNLFSGPILGYQVSGYEAERTVYRTLGGGSPWLTGGAFGIEGSVWIAVVECLAIAVLLWRIRRQA